MCCCCTNNSRNTEHLRPFYIGGGAGYYARGARQHVCVPCLLRSYAQCTSGNSVPCSMVHMYVSSAQRMRVRTYELEEVRIKSQHNRLPRQQTRLFGMSSSQSQQSYNPASYPIGRLGICKFRISVLQQQQSSSPAPLHHNCSGFERCATKLARLSSRRVIWACSVVVASTVGAFSQQVREPAPLRLPLS